MKKIILTISFVFSFIILCSAQVSTDKLNNVLFIIKSKGQPDIHYSTQSPRVALSTIRQNTIKSMEVLKDSIATKMYGKEGENGVIIITTVDSISLINEKILLKNYKLARKSDNLPIYIDGVHVKNAENMYFDPTGIKSITIETTPDTKEKYLYIKTVNGLQAEPTGVMIR